MPMVGRMRMLLQATMMLLRMGTLSVVMKITSFFRDLTNFKFEDLTAVYFSLCGFL